MKKLVTITIVVALVMGMSVAAMASATQWTMVLKATDLSNQNFNPNLTIGTMAGYTDGLDSTKGEPGTINPTPSGKTLATVSTVLPGTTKPAILDVKAPIVAGDVKIWDINAYTMDNNGAGIAAMKILITPGTGTSAPVYTFGTTAYEYTFTGSMVPGGKVVYDAAHPMPASFFFTFEGTSATVGDDVLQLKVASVPEPSSMLALASGLFGMAGFAIRRRK